MSETITIYLGNQEGAAFPIRLDAVTGIPEGMLAIGTLDVVVDEEHIPHHIEVMSQKEFEARGYKTEDERVTPILFDGQRRVVLSLFEDTSKRVLNADVLEKQLPSGRLVIPPQDTGPGCPLYHPGYIEQGKYTVNEFVDLLREHKDNPEAIQFLADMLEI